METMRDFGLKTSIKGIPRALKSQSTSMRVLWSVSVVLFLGMACLQSYWLAIDYLAFDVTTTFSEYRVDLSGYTEQSVQLPHVTICNTNPFGSNAGIVADIPTLKEFYDRVLNITSCSKCSSAQSESLKQARELFLTPEAYAEYIGPFHVKQVGHSLQSMLVDCQLILMEGRILKYKPCFPGMKVIYRYDVKYYNCYTLQIPTPSIPSHSYFGLALVLHLDNFFHGHRKYFNKTNIRNRMNGIELSFHAPNTPPALDFESVFLPPGFMADIRVGFERRKRKPLPYGDCKVHIDTLPNNTTYAWDYCYATCIQSHVTDACDCLDQNPYADVYKSYTNITKCLDINRGYEDIIQTWECVVHERYAAMLPCSSQCTYPCEELSYNYQVGWVVKTICLPISNFNCLFILDNRFLEWGFAGYHVY